MDRNRESRYQRRSLAATPGLAFGDAAGGRLAVDESTGLPVLELQRPETVANTRRGLRRSRRLGEWEVRLPAHQVRPELFANLREGCAWRPVGSLFARDPSLPRGLGVPRARSIRHLHTSPYRAETNDKAERFIQKVIRGWVYREPYGTSNQRTKALPKWLRYYNEQRPHRTLGMISPLVRIRSAA